MAIGEVERAFQAFCKENGVIPNVGSKKSFVAGIDFQRTRKIPISQMSNDKRKIQSLEDEIQNLKARLKTYTIDSYSKLKSENADLRRKVETLESKLNDALNPAERAVMLVRGI